MSPDRSLDRPGEGRARVAWWWLDSALLYGMIAALIFPVFGLEYLDNWKSIEATFIADGRMLRETWPHHLWQPIWYCGTKAGYVYPPGLKYGVAIVSAVFQTSAAHAYHVVIGLLYAFGIVATYLFCRAATKSRGAAWLASIATALVSPCFLLLRDLREDSLFHVPQRLHVLMSYGEGPHISSLALLPIVWMAAWRRFEGGSVRWIALSAAAAAALVTINFYGLTALILTMAWLVWSWLLKTKDWRIARDAAAIGILAYGLTAWWLVPSYASITSRNLYLVSERGNSWSLAALIALVILYAAASLLLRRLKHFSVYTFFIASGVWWLSAYILGFRWFGFVVTGNPIRLVPELDVFAILAGVELARAAWKWRPAGALRLAPRFAVVVLLFFVFRPGWRYLKHAYHEFPAARDWQSRVEFRTPAWLWEHFPDRRAFVNGSIRYWYNAWHDGQQADGGSQQGILNPVLPAAQWLILHGNDPEVSRHWLQALGVDVLVVPGKESQEEYKDFSYPEMYAALLPVLHDDGRGNLFYRVPRRAPGIVRLVDRARMDAVPEIRLDGVTTQIHAYAEAVEAVPPGGAAPDRSSYQWRGTDELDVTAEVQPGEALLVVETYDPSWRAYLGEAREPVARDAAGFMLVTLPPGRQRLRMMFETSPEVAAGDVIAILSLAMIALLVFMPKRPAARP